MIIQGGFPEFLMGPDEQRLYDEVTSHIKDENFSPDKENFDFKAHQNSFSLMNKFVINFKKDHNGPVLLEKIYNIFFKIFCPTILSQTLEEKIELAEKNGQLVDLAIHILLVSGPIELFANIDKFKLENAGLLKICKLIFEMRLDSDLFNNFSKLNLSLKSFDDHLFICNEIAKLGNSESIITKNCFGKLGLIERVINIENLDDRISECKKIATKGKWAAEGLLNLYHKLGLENATFDQLLPLYNVIANQGVYAYVILFTIKLFNLISSIDDINLRISCYKKFITQEESPLVLERSISILLSRWDQLNLKNATIEQKLEFYKEIVVQGEESARDLFRKYRVFGLENATNVQLFEFFLLIVRQGAYSAIELVSIFSELKFENDEKRLELCHAIASTGQVGAEALANKFLDLGLEHVSADQRLELCIAIAMNGDGPATALASSLEFGELGLKNANIDGRLRLYNTIIKQGPNALNKLALNIDKIGLTDATKDQCMALCKKILIKGSEDSSIIYPIVRFLERLNLDDKLIMSINNLLSSLNIEQNLFDYIPLCPSSPENRRQSALDFLKNYLSIHYGNQQDDVKIAQNHWLFPLKPILNILFSTSENFTTEKVDKLIQFIEGNKNLLFLKEILTQIKSESDRIQQSLTKWVAYTAGVLNDLKITDEQAKLIVPMVKYIYLHRNPSNRYLYIRALSDLILQNPKELTNLKPGNKNNYITLASLLISQLKENGLSNKLQQALLNRLDQISEFEDTKQFTLFANLISKLVLNGPYQQNEIDILVQGIINLLGENKPRNLQKSLPEMDATKHLYDEKLLPLIKGALQTIPDTVGVEKRTKILRDRKKKLIDYIDDLMANQRYISGNAKNEIDVMLENSGPNHDPEIKSKLEVYLIKCPPKTVNISALAKAIEDENESRKSEFTRIIKELLVFSNVLAMFGQEELLNCLSENRNYQTLLQDHFCRLFDVSKVEDLNTKYFNTFAQFRDKNAIYSYLKSINSLNSDHKVKVKKAFSNYIVAVLNGTFEKLRYSSENSPHLQKINEKFPDLLNEWEKINSIAEKSVDKYRVKMSHDPCDLLLIGTEVNHSCQSINREPHLNKCLVSYLINGDIQAIVAKQEGSDKIKARCMLRIMWDDVNQKPVLLLEALYLNIEKNDTLVEAFIALAKEKANALMIPLVSKDVGKGKAYQGNIEFLGGAAPFVYSDAAGGAAGVYSGTFKVIGCHVLN
jgi:hypothetical protein